MALSPYTLIIGTKSDDPFNVIPNAPYEIRHRDTATGASLGLANIFSDPAGLVPITQTGATVNDRGTVVFYAEAVPLNAEYNNGTSIVQPIDVGVSNQTLIDLGRVIPFDILQDAIDENNTAKIFNGAALNLKERTTGNGGGAMWDVVLASSVTPNTFNIVQCVGIPTLALVLRVQDSTIYSGSWGLVGGIDETLGLQTFLQSMIDNNYKATLEPKEYVTTSQLVSELVSERNFDLSCPIGRAVIRVDAVINRLIEMNECFSLRCENVDFDLNENCPMAISIRTTNANARDVQISFSKVTGCQQTTQSVSATAFFVLGPYDNINITDNNITSCDRVNPALFSQAIAVFGVTGICHIARNRIANVDSPSGSFDVDGVLVFGAQNGDATQLDAGKVTIEDNDFIDCKGRFVKSQHTDTTITNNRGTISDNAVLITNWRFADFQMGNGICTENTCLYGSGVTADGGGSVSPALARFANNKNVAPLKASICSDNTLKTETVWAQVVISDISNGHTSVKIQDNHFGQHNVMVLHTGDVGSFTEAYYSIHDNAIESKVQLFDVVSDQQWFNMFVGVTDNDNIDTQTGHFRQVFPLGGTFSLESNFVVRGNSRMIERVEWVFNFDRLTQGNAFQHGSQLNTGRPFSGEGHTVVDGLMMSDVPANALARWQRCIVDPNASTWSTWRSVVYS
ncbi:MAG TPA: hypothetical protein EYN67_02045 [Flavobacteriales bacterium]|nr:hypothetical protein [Methylococcaceae bacterium]HHZ94346.1 hypothetical protein [Flavobacteriales bacterium]